MVNRLRNNPVFEHASNLGALIAYEIANSIGVSAYIYDSVRVDEMLDIARVSGMPDITRTSTCHALNSRAMVLLITNVVPLLLGTFAGTCSLNLPQKGRKAGHDCLWAVA